MKKVKECGALTVVWVIMAVIMIAAALNILSSTDQIVKNLNNNMPKWLIEIPAFIGLIVGFLSLLRSALEVLIGRRLASQ
jgi:mannose/fructose/N-acetylgalactosamine-specific phosphotransferase system component IIC